MVDQAIVEVLTTQMGVTSGCFDFENALLDGEQRDIESASTEIKDQNILLAAAFLVQDVSDGGSRRFVDDTENIEAGNNASILRRLPLGVVEVCGDSDDRVADGRAKVCFCSFLHFSQNHGGDLFWALSNVIR